MELNASSRTVGPERVRPKLMTDPVIACVKEDYVIIHTTINFLLLLFTTHTSKTLL